jgi:hypothetical protein
MASRGTNDVARRLQQRQAAARRAATAVGRAAAAVSAVEERRAALLEQLSADAVSARSGLDVALVVLADLVGEDGASEVADAPVSEIRAARRRADGAAVREAAAAVRQRPAGRARSVTGPAVEHRDQQKHQGNER